MKRKTCPERRRRIRVGVIFGGKSGEHEVSLMSAQSVMRAIDKGKYEVVPIGITHEGRWLTGGDPLKALTGGQTSMPQLLESGYALDANAPGGQAPPEHRELVPGAQAAGIPEVDVVFPVLHGTYGEDGTVQGLLELADIPYVGAGVMASAVAMDKAIMKDVLRSHGLPVVDHILVKRSRWEDDPVQARPEPKPRAERGGRRRIRAQVAESIGYPCFVKPANLGSSVGISKAHTEQELDAAIELAAQYDRKILIEKCVEQAREIEVSVLGNDDPIASTPGEVIPSREFYDYAAKYLDNASELLVPAPLDAETSGQIRQLAIEAYLAFDCAGMARVDFLLSRATGELFIGEVNTIPGFTAISMYPKLWEASGVPYPELIDRLIDLALERHSEKQRTRTTYDVERME